jgi:hypothetical protein
VRGERAAPHRPRPVASSNVVDCMLQGSGAAGQRSLPRASKRGGSGKVGSSERLGTGVLFLPICPAAPLPTPQLQLRFLFHDTIERERDGAYRQTLGVSQDKSAASGISELSVERCG